VIDNGFDDLATFSDGNRVQTIDLGETSVLKNLWSSIKLGVDHIKTGPDHILFVLVLLLPSVLVFRNGWKPTDTFMTSLWRVLKVVTMFTIAHSITFTLAGLEIVPLPSPRIVESIIAISIAAAALHNIRPIVPNQEWWLAFVFGLFHGLGFASLISGLEVSRSTQLISLLGRNIGIEIGQVIVVLLLFPGLFLLRRTVQYRPFFVVVSVVLAVLAVAWMIERAFEVDLSTDAIVDPVFDFPRILWWVAGFTLIAFAIQRYEASNDRLLPTAGPGPATDDADQDLETVG
ncbi:MAG: HupE/UreJ family protein, partial [Actinomycetota bacterium]